MATVIERDVCLFPIPLPLRLLPMSDGEKDIEILARQHRLLTLQCQVGESTVANTVRLIRALVLRRRYSTGRAALSR
ncbi:hypothetical protein [Saccharothrix sp. ST-888]|uniref:hypothetical protein n=1 Tax=Saccharothrix sp. ST-888 TaxID=1427391 RepID=UPI0012E07CA0|nr:hypothetical protein [Saccharothrix sp. ST-888]